jgi:catechol 2,3-dioxygenase-like lactoylglutathione lyase family enzyme
LVDDLEFELSRLRDLGAELLEGPMGGNGGPLIAFIRAPDDVRIELLQPPE